MINLSRERVTDRQRQINRHAEGKRKTNRHVEGERQTNRHEEVERQRKGDVKVLQWYGIMMGQRQRQRTDMQRERDRMTFRY